MWDAIEKDISMKSDIFKVEASQQLTELRCAEGEDMCIHLGQLVKGQDELLTMGLKLSKNEFTQIILTSLT